jgi:poly(A) polymerase
MLLKYILNEISKDAIALEYLSDLVKSGPFKNKAFLAGGSPRDMQLGLSPHDLDVVIKGDINAGIDFAKWATEEIGRRTGKKIHAPVIFPTFGTAKFTLSGVNYKGYDLSDVDIECVAPRKEKYTSGNRKPEVSSGELKDDVFRRDFLVNSLLYDLTSGETLDLTGMGKDDIKKGIIRTPLDPNITFKEDPLRILRCMRFSAKYNWKLPMFMIRAVKKNAPQLKNISRERIQVEIDKILLTDRATQSIRLMKILGLIPYVFSDLVDKPKEEYTLLKFLPKDIPLRLAGIFSEVGSDIAEKDLRETKYDLDTIKTVSMILDHFHKLLDNNASSDESVRDEIDILGKDKYNVVLSFAKGYASYKGVNLAADELSLKSTEQSQYMKQHPLPIDGQCLIDLGIKPGPVFKTLLDLVRRVYIKNPETPKETYLSVIKKNMQK